MVLRLLDVPCFDEGMDELGLHFLDIIRKGYCGTSPQWEGADTYKPRTPCATELSEAGIQFRKSKNTHYVDFENGVLSMPRFKVADQTEANLLNLMAFEWLHPDANSFVTSYISFLDKIIESERDVALLRSRGLFENMIGSDNKVVKMFNILTKLARTPMPGSELSYVNLEGKQPLQEATEQMASHLHDYLSEQPLGDHLHGGCLHLTRRRRHADCLHGCRILHQKGLTRTLWLPVLFITSYMSLCVLIASVSLHYFFLNCSLHYFAVC